MNRKVAGLSLLIGVALTLALCSALLAAPLGVGFMAGNLKFAKTMAPADQAYLGLKSPGPFTLKDIQADYVLVEVLNADCPHCMEQAAALNRLYRLVEASDLKDRIKFIGVVSNSDAQGGRVEKRLQGALSPGCRSRLGNRQRYPQDHRHPHHGGAG